MISASLSELRTLSGGVTGIVDVACPWCGPYRRSPANRTRKVLRIWDDGDFVNFKCIRCGETGWARDDQSSRTIVARPKPAPKVDRGDLVNFLWKQSMPAIGTVVETYLRNRKCWLQSPNIRFLPANDRHPPSMIARFGYVPVTGVHITRLNGDGGKAGTDSDKIMLGDSIGQPIVVHRNDECADLIVTEGIEDALSFAIGLGYNAWAAGSANRIPHVLIHTYGYDRIYIAVDDDRAGKGALKRSLMIAPVTPIKLGTLDANSMLQRYGVTTLVAAVEWCDLQQQCRDGKITHNQLMNGLAKLGKFMPEDPW